MKPTLLPRLFPFAFCLFTFDFLFSQAPQGVNYQAIARDAGGNPIATQTVNVDFVIHRGSAAGPSSWNESFSPVTNPYGLFNLVIGSTSPANFDTIAWGKNQYWLEVKVNTIAMGTTKLMSVPYALHANTADSLLYPPSGTSIWKKTGGKISPNVISDSVGIGTASPSGKLSVLVAAGSVDGFNVAHQGTGRAGVFSQNNPANDSAALVSYTNGKGTAVFGINMGTGHGGVFSVNNPSSGGNGLIGSSNGNGKAVFGYQTGLGYGGAFWINNPANDSAAVIGLTNGDGPAVYGMAGGSGNAGLFEITNVTSTAASVRAVTSSPTGYAGEFIGRVKIVDGTQGAGKVLTSDAAGIASWQSPGASSAWSLTGNALTGGASTPAEWFGSSSAHDLIFKTNNIECMRIQSGGNIGIGTTSPSQLLDVRSTDPALANGILSRFRYTPALTANGAVNYTTHRNELIVNSTFNFSAQINGAVNTVQIQAGQTGTISNAVGAQNYVTNSSTTPTLLYGSQNNVTHSSSGTLTQAHGASAAISNTSTGVISNANAITSSISNSGGGSITNGYGLYVGTIQATNKFSIYASDATAKSYFAGNVGINSTSPLLLLDVRGSNAKVSTAAFQNLFSVGSSDVGTPLVFRIGIKTDVTATNRYGAIEVDDNGTKRSLSLQPTGGNIGLGNINPSSVLDLNGSLTVRGMAAPAVSPATQGRIYFDSGSNKFKVSENNGAYVDLITAPSGDNLGNHTATQNIILGTNWLSGDGGSEGIYVDANGVVGVGTNAPESNARMHVLGRITVQGSQSAGLHKDAGGSDQYLVGLRSDIAPGKFVFANLNIPGNDWVFDNGNVGVGINNPAEKLEVAGKTKTTDFQMTSGAAANLVLTSMDGMGNAAWTLPSVAAFGGWSTSGNSGTTDGTDFIGTVDNVPLSIRVNNQKSGRIDQLNSNTFLGYWSGLNSTGNQNSAYGTNSLLNTSTGGQNTAMGVAALQTNVTGSDNTAVGAFADVSGPGLSNATAIGANAVVSSSNSLVLGNAANVGIGISAPTSKLHVSGGMSQHFYTTSTNFEAALVADNTNGTSPGWFNGVIGIKSMASNDNLSDTKFGVQSGSTGNDGTKYGVYGTAGGTGGAGTSHYGLFGSAAGSVPNAYGIYAQAMGTGSTSTGGYFTASGATNNYAGIFDQGLVGIGVLAPDAKLALTHTAASTARDALKINFSTGLASAGPTTGINTSMTVSATGANYYGHYSNVSVTSNANIVGMFGWATGGGTGTKVGVEGYSDASSGNNEGVAGWAWGTTTGTNYGLFGSAQNGATNYGLFVSSGETKITDAGAAVPGRTAAGSIATSSSGGNRIYYRTTTGNYFINNSGVGDYSEYFRTSDSLIEIGEIVSIDPAKDNSVRKAGKNNESVIGVVSKYGTRNNDDQEGQRMYDKKYVNVGLLGQVMVKVSEENGHIAPGDALTLSEKFPGVAVKAVSTERIIGYALTHYPYVAGEAHYPTHSDAKGEKDCLKAPHVMAFIQPTLWSVNGDLQKELKAQKEEIEKIKLQLGIKAEAGK